MTLQKLSQEELEDWLTSPVTQTLHSLCKNLLALQKEAALDAYWNGKPIDTADQKAMKKYEEFLEDFFETDADDINATMESMKDERERDKSD